MKNKSPQNYDQKFANFITLCERAKADGIQQVIVDRPSVLGDSYDEIIESLSRLADAGLALNITRR